MFKLKKQSFYEIKKSKFYGFLYEIDNEIEIEIILSNLKKENKKARHICYGFKIGDKIKFFDDGEPKGTAWMPIQNFFKSNNLNNEAIFIVRYFGNIKLGVGGLYRAYSKCLLELKNA